MKPAIVIVGALATGLMLLGKKASAAVKGGDRGMGFLPDSKPGMGSGHEWALSLPIGPTPDREEAILRALEAGIVRYNWAEITIQAMIGDVIKTARVAVTDDALGVGGGEDFVRFNAGYDTAVIIGDAIGATMMTSKIADEVYKQSAHKPSPTILSADPVLSNQMADMQTTRWMVIHSDRVSKKLGPNAEGLKSNVGKDWVMTNRFWESPQAHGIPNPKKRSANYGWYAKTATSTNIPRTLRLYQSIGLKHELSYKDYSQVVRLMGRRCVIDGDEWDICEAMTNPALAPLFSDEGALMSCRHPGL